MSQPPSDSSAHAAPHPTGAQPPGASTPDSYDVLPYISRSFVQTHPDNLAVAGLLRGMKPAPSTAAECLSWAVPAAAT